MSAAQPTAAPPPHRPSLERASWVVVLALALLTLAAPSAFAAKFHSFSTSFGTSGAGAGQLALVSPDYSFQNPAGLLPGSGLAVNATSHDVYIADTGNHRVDQFSSAGSFIRAWGWGVADGSAELQTCTATCQAGISGSGPGQFESPLAIAIDNSTGDLYVADSTSLAGPGTDLVQKFDSTGNLITAWATGGQLDGSAAIGGPFSGELAGIAVDPSGNLFVNDLNQNVFEFAADGTAGPTVPVSGPEFPSGLATDSSANLYRAANTNGQVDRLDSSGNILGTIDAFTGPSTGFAVDLSNGDVFSGDGSVIRHYAVYPSGDVIEPDGSTCPVVPGFAGCGQTDEFGNGSLLAAAGLAVDPSNAAVFAADAGNARIDLFTSFILADTVTNPASAIGQTTATLNGHLDPAGGGDVSDCHFEYADDASFQANGFAGAQTAPCAEGNSFASPANVTAPLTGLAAGTTYHYRLLTTDPQGTNKGADQPFTTAPPVALTIAPASPIGASTATLNGHVDSGGGGDITDCHFEFADDASFQAHGFSGAQTQACAPATPISTPTDVSAEIAGLTPDTLYHVRLVATDGLGTSQTEDLPFTTLPVPVIDAAFASNLTPTDADLNAAVNPRGFQLTDCHFEWGTDTSYGQSVACSPDAASIPADSSDHAVSAHLSGLTQNTTYHWRIVATDANGTVGTDADHTFVYDTTGQDLPDNRAYEMVTPPQKNGAVIGYIAFGGRPDLSEDGSRAVIYSIQCFADSTSCTASRNSEGEPFAFDRTPAGWLTTALSPPASDLGGNSSWLASADAGTALFSVASPPGGQDDWVARQAGGSFADIGPATQPSGGPQSPQFWLEGNIAATADLSRVVWNVNVPGSNGNGLWPPDPSSGNGAYEYGGTGNSQPLFVGVGGPNDGPGSTDLISDCGTSVGKPETPSGNYPGSLSADGQIIYFTAWGSNGGSCSGSVFGTGANASTPVPFDALYARIDNAGPAAHTVPISQRSPLDCTTSSCTASAPANAVFQGASEDGSVASFLSTQQLTDDASDGSTNLYLYDFNNPAGHRLLDASAGDTSGNGPRVQGLMALSADGSHAYFVAKGVLSTDPNAQGKTPVDGADNLYLYEHDAAHPSGHTAFIGTLLASDDNVGAPDFTSLWLNGPVTANVTPDGRFLVFPSAAPLTSEAPSPAGAHQIFRYDAQTGDLLRLSIGAAGFNDNGNASTGQASIVPAQAFDYRAGPARNDPTMAHDGSRVFFMSPAALTPHALDDVAVGSQGSLAQNLYEWEQAGVGSCPVGESGGCVYLISDGRDATATSGNSSVRLIGTDANGDNVFFRTADPLVPQDPDTMPDFYDARVGGGIPYTPPPEPCQGDNCKPPPSNPPPPIGRGGSDTFSGPGNPKPKRHHKKRRHHNKNHHRVRHHHRRGSDRHGGGK